MKFKKLITVMVIAVLALSAFVGCGAKENT